MKAPHTRFIHAIPRGTRLQGPKTAMLAAICALALLQSGCRTPATRRSTPNSTPPTVGLCHILVRLTSSVDGNAANPFTGQTRFVFMIANLNADQPPRIVRPKPVNDLNLAKQGWAYLLLEPGAYHVTAHQNSAPDPQYTPETFRLYVPTSHRLGYAGSFHALDHRERWSITDGAVPFIGGHLITLNGIRFDFEPVAAEEVAKREFEALGPLKSTRLHPESEFSADCPLSELGDIAVMTRAADAVEPPHWVSRAANDFVNAAIVPGAPGGLGAFVMAYDLAALPFAATTGAIEGKAAKKKWASCLDELSREFADFHLAAQLQSALLEKLGTNGPTGLHAIDPSESLEAQAAAKDFPYILCAEARKIGLSQGKKRGQVGVEIKFRFRLLDTQAEDCLFDCAFSPECRFREMKEFAGESGRAQFRNDLTEAVQSGVEWFSQQVMPPVTDQRGAKI